MSDNKAMAQPERPTTPNRTGSATGLNNNNNESYISSEMMDSFDSARSHNKSNSDVSKVEPPVTPDLSLNMSIAPTIEHEVKGPEQFIVRKQLLEEGGSPIDSEGLLDKQSSPDLNKSNLS